MSKRTRPRKYSYSRVVTAGCFVCGPDQGSTGKWFSPNAQGIAARHHDATGHQTWVDATLSITYGDEKEGTGT